MFYFEAREERPRGVKVGSSGACRASHPFLLGRTHGACRASHPFLLEA